MHKKLIGAARASPHLVVQTAILSSVCLYNYVCVCVCRFIALCDCRKCQKSVKIARLFRFYLMAPGNDVCSCMRMRKANVVFSFKSLV